LGPRGLRRAEGGQPQHPGFEETTRPDRHGPRFPGWGAASGQKRAASIFQRDTGGRRRCSRATTDANEAGRGQKSGGGKPFPKREEARRHPGPAAAPIRGRRSRTGRAESGFLGGARGRSPQVEGLGPGGGGQLWRKGAFGLPPRARGNRRKLKHGGQGPRARPTGFYLERTSANPRRGVAKASFAAELL